MTYKVFAIAPFIKEARRLMGKYPSLKKELTNLEVELSKNPVQGTPIGKNCFKVRIAIASKGKGKSGGGDHNSRSCDRRGGILAFYL